MKSQRLQLQPKARRHGSERGRSVVVAVIVSALVAVAVAGGVGYRLGYVRRPGGESAAQAPGERKPLFYRNPMNAAITSPVPARDEMGMDYIPVYADAAGKPEQAKTPEQELEDFFAEEGTGVGGGGPEGLATVTLGRSEIEVAGVQAVPAEQGRIHRTVRAVGRVVPDERRVRHVHTKIGGWVERLYVNFSGQAVERGKPLLELYSPELLATQQELVETRRAAERLAGAGDPRIQAEAAGLVEAARRRLELYDVPASFIAELERTGKPRRAVTLVAPAGGYVTSKGILEGQQVETGTELYTITDLTHIWVEADLYEFEAAAAREGESAVLTLPYDPSLRLEGEVTYVSPVLDPETRTLRVRVEFANPELVLKPGMFVDVNMALESGEGVIVPESAIIDSGARQVVFVGVGPGRFEPRLVRVGIRGEGRAQVIAGVRAGEPVVVKANFLLDSESRLRSLVEQATAAAAK